MRSFTYAALFAGSAAAQSTAVVLNLLFSDPTLISKGTENGVTTYINECPAGQGGLSPVPGPTGASSTGSVKASLSSIRSSATNVALTPIASPPATTAPARLRRQASNNSDDDTLCEPYTIKQGSEKWEFHMTDPTPGQWTIDGGCNWKGDMKTADLTCTMTQSGKLAEEIGGSDAVGVHTETLKPSDVKSIEAIRTVSVVSASATKSDSASGTASGTAAATASGTASASGSGAPAASTAMAPAGPLPTGAIAFVGGAAGILAAAFAL